MNSATKGLGFRFYGLKVKGLEFWVKLCFRWVFFCFCKRGGAGVVEDGHLCLLRI